jgi:GNAT superfamily N-acetyltransferase
MSDWLRVAVDGELTEVAALMNRSYRSKGAGRSWTNEDAYLQGERTSEAALRDDLEKKAGSLLLVTGGEPITGCVWLEPKGAGTWYLGSLTVDPSEQNLGMGRRLLEAAEAWVVTPGGGTRIEMTVINVRDTLIAWYVRRGYHLTGEQLPFPYQDERFGVPTRDDLAFVVLAKDMTAKTSAP